MSTKCPRSLTSLGGIASKFKTAVGKIADGGPGVQSSLPAVVMFAHTVPHSTLVHDKAANVTVADNIVQIECCGYNR